MNTSGKFVISLDFELFWGVRDHATPETYGENILGVWQALPAMLKLFDAYGVNATFATVGMLFASSRQELESFIPDDKPAYAKPNLSPYNGHLELLKETEAEDQYHYASELIALIRNYPRQEISTHTFSHYYCLEEGQDLDDFRADLEAAIKIARSCDIELKSLVFPRNQFNSNYLNVCAELGIDSYRGNEKVWFHQAVNGQGENLWRRAFRLADAYVNISGHRCHELSDIAKEYPYNIPSSRFLRPYTPSLKWLEGLRLRRILKSMEYAAKNGKVYHLWWHPHNFGTFQAENLDFLRKILEKYKDLHTKYDFESITMRELADSLNQKKDA